MRKLVDAAGFTLNAGLGTGGIAILFPPVLPILALLAWASRSGSRALARRLHR